MIVERESLAARATTTCEERAAIRRVMDRVRALPGVESASLASIVPFGEIPRGAARAETGTAARCSGSARSRASLRPRRSWARTTSRRFGSRSCAAGASRSQKKTADSAPRVAILDEPSVRRLFGNEDALGRRVQLGGSDSPTKQEAEVIGIVAGIRDDIFEKVPTPHVLRAVRPALPRRA